MLENLIRQRVHFTRVARTGFHHCICEVCHDHTDRGGFKFEGGEIGYNCFNCGASARYTENSGQISRKFRKYLHAFSISDEDIDKEINKAFFKNSGDTEGKTITLKDITQKPEKKNYLITPEVPLPEDALKLGSDQGIEVQERIVDYLMGRKIDPFAFPFYFSLNPKFINYVIIPFFRNGKVIYWQGRNYVDPSIKKRYNNCTESKENIIFNFDELFRGASGSPLFVSEGVFDALPLNGIALIGSKINEAKIEIMKKSRRDLIFVIDKDKNGRMVAEKALENGWKITFAPQFTGDVNKSIITHGLCWTTFQLFKNIPQNVFEAKTKIELYCGK